MIIYSCRVRQSDHWTSPGLSKLGKRLLASFCCTDGRMGKFHLHVWNLVKMIIAPWLQKRPKPNRKSAILNLVLFLVIWMHCTLTNSSQIFNLSIQILLGYLIQNLVFLLKGLAAWWISIAPLKTKVAVTLLHRVESAQNITPLIKVLAWINEYGNILLRS